MFKYAYWQIPSCFNKKEIKQINSFILKKNDGNESADKPAKNKIAKVKHIAWNKVEHFLKPLVERALYIGRTEFGYELYPLSHGEFLNYNTYRCKDKASYDWHIDTSQNALWDIKLTLLINISDKPYKGGKFKIYHCSNKVDVSELDIPGNMIMFNSSLHHTVRPITSGERKTLTIFFKGPAFK
tara:strand:+ start:712 stop:1263 length:552 start_codon:yes stop_codon:yes gene_type:complete